MKNSSLEKVKNFGVALGSSVIFFLAYVMVDISSAFLVSGDGYATPLTPFMEASDALIAHLFGLDMHHRPVFYAALFYACICGVLVFFYRSCRNK